MSSDLYCTVGGCSRKPIGSRLLCRKHLRAQQAEDRRHDAETWNAAVRDAARESALIMSPADTVRELTGMAVNKAIAEFVKTPSVERRVFLMGDLSTLLATLPADQSPFASVAETFSGTEIEMALKSILARARDRLPALKAGLNEAWNGDAVPNLALLRALLDAQEIDARCLEAFGLGGTSVASCIDLREKLARLEAGQPAETNSVPSPGGLLGAREAARLAADYVRAHHDGDTDALARIAVGHEGGLLAGELAISELVWSLFQKHADNESVCQIFDQFVETAEGSKGMQTAVQLVSERLNLPFQGRWLAADDRQLSEDDVRATNLAFASVIDVGVSVLGDDSTRWEWSSINSYRWY